MVKDIFTLAMESSGQEVSTDICEHFQHTRQELYDIVRVSKRRRKERTTLCTVSVYLIYICRYITITSVFVCEQRVLSSTGLFVGLSLL